MNLTRKLFILVALLEFRDHSLVILPLAIFAIFDFIERRCLELVIDKSIVFIFLSKRRYIIECHSFYQKYISFKLRN